MLGEIGALHLVGKYVDCRYGMEHGIGMGVHLKYLLAQAKHKPAHTATPIDTLQIVRRHARILLLMF